MAKSLYLIDGHAQIYRAFYAPFRDLTSPSGEPTRATFVFCQMLLNLIKQRKPDYLAMTMDVSDKTVFRCDIDPNYKANREPAPDALYVQMDRIVSIVQALGVPIYREQGFEADDLMATIATNVAQEDVQVYLVSRDKDLEQLITDRVRLYDPMKDEIVDAAKLAALKGYTPEQAVEIQTLTGDSTDNIPGVQGVGLKTAAKLIGQYGSAQAVIDHPDELTPKMAEQVRAFASKLHITRELVTLRKDVPLSFDLQACRIDRLQYSAVRPIFDELGFTRLRDLLRSMDEDGTGRDGRTSQVNKTDQDGRAAQGEWQLDWRDAKSGKSYYRLVDSPQALSDLATALAQQSAFAFDTETTSLHPVSAELVGLSFSWEAGKACYVPVRTAVGKTLPVDLVVKKLKPVFENDAVAKVGHNLKFDMLALRQIGIEVAGVSFDTMIAGFLLGPTGRSHSLDGLALSLLGHTMIPISELIGKGKNQITIDQADLQQVCEYASEDADFTWRLYGVLAPQIEAGDVKSLFHETEMPLVDVLTQMEHNGIALDVPLLQTLGATLTKRMDALCDEIHQEAGRPFNIDSTKQLAEVLYDEHRLPIIKKTKTGRSTDAETLSALVERTDHPIPKLILEYRELSKLKGTYVDTLPRMVVPRTGRVHATFHQIGAVTGRLSSSDPNLQNIPIRTETGRRIREAFVACNEDHVLLTADYSQVELRVLAHFCQDQALIEAFREGMDIHRVVAAEVNGIAPEAVTTAQRNAAKAINFGIIYGQSAFGLARSLGIPRTEAQEFIDTYFNRYPGIRRFIDQCIRKAREQGFVRTILGRRRPIPELQSRNRTQVSLGERLAVNTVIQGSAADLIKRAMVNIHQELKTGRYQAKLLVQVHDELVLEVAKDTLNEVAHLVSEKMSTALPLDVPLAVDTSWGRTWSKG